MRSSHDFFHAYSGNPNFFYGYAGFFYVWRCQNGRKTPFSILQLRWKPQVNVARSNMMLYGLNGSSLRYAQALAPSEPEALARAYRLEDGPARAVQSVQKVDETPADIQSVQVDIFDWSGAENSPPAPLPLDGKVCAGCGAAPQDKPGTWYVFDHAAFCPACAPSATTTAGEGCVIEVRHG